MPTCKTLVQNTKRWGNIIITTAIASLGCLGIGTVFGWSAVAVASIKETGHFNQVTDSMVSWVTSLAIFGALFGGPLGGVIMDRMGRKPGIRIFAVFSSLGWLTMISAYFFRPGGFFLLYIGRVLTGFSAGGLLVILPAYLKVFFHTCSTQSIPPTVKEISYDFMRGMLGSTLPLFAVLGVLYSFVIGRFVDWFVITICSSVFTTLLVLGTFYIPDTPRYFVVKNKLDKAIASFKWLSKLETDEIALEEMMGIFTIFDQDKKEAPKRRKFLTRPVIVPVLIMVLLMFFQQFTGTNVVQLYTVEIFQDTGDSAVSPKTATVILGIVYVVSNFVSLFVIDLLGRRTLIVSLNLVMAISLAGLGTYFYLKEKGDGSEKRVLWLPSVSIYAYAAAYCCGIGSVPWVLGVELYNPDYSAESATLMTTSYWVFGFTVAKTFEDLKNALNVSGTFWFYASFCVGGAIFTAAFIPETRGKSSEEILRYYGGLDSRVGGELITINTSHPEMMTVSETPSPLPPVLEPNIEETQLEFNLADKKAGEVPLFEHPTEPIMSIQ